MPQLAANQFDRAAVEIIKDDQSLKQLYVDRIISRRDLARLEQDWVREAVREAIGLYDELWPAVMRSTETTS